MFKQIVLAACVIAACAAPKALADGSFLQVGEELTYRVSYLNVTLGTIKTVVEPFTTLDGRKVAKVKIFINSAPGIPLVSLHSIYESWMDTSASFSYKFNANTENTESSTWDFDQYLMDYKNKKLSIDKFKNKQKVSSKSVDISRPYNDGSSLLFAARSLLLSKKAYKMPTVIMDDTVGTVVNFTGKREEVDIDASDKAIKTVYLTGDANWTGLYGLSGRFEGWFSDDDARVPIKAKMKVYAGSVTIELQSWKRNNWQPPKAD